MERRFFPGQESVAEVHDRHAREVKRGNQRFEVMVSVDEIGCEADFVQTADDGHRRGAQFFGNGTEGQAERHRPMASADEGAADIADPELRPGPLGQCVVSEEDREGSHEADETSLSGCLNRKTEQLWAWRPLTCPPNWFRPAGKSDRRTVIIIRTGSNVWAGSAGDDLV